MRKAETITFEQSLTDLEKIVEELEDGKIGLNDALQRYDGIVEQASEAELADSCARADRTGLFNCPHTGVALAAMEKLVKRGEIKKSDRVVVISTAHGLKFVDFKVKYHEMQLEGIGSAQANPPIELPASYPVVRDEMLRQIDERFARSGR